MRRETARGRSQFVEPKINHPSDDSERPLGYHVSIGYVHIAHR